MKRMCCWLSLLFLALLSCCDLLGTAPPYAYGKASLLHGPDRVGEQEILLRLELQNRGTSAIRGFTVSFLLFAADGQPLLGISNNVIRAVGDCLIPPGGMGLIDVQLEQYFYYLVGRILVVESLCVDELVFNDGTLWRDYGQVYQYPDAIVSEAP
jgi:hypothetical protein